ncbi:MAG TPA: serine/threonine-protein kinase [Kofleriaceae bacterium]|nr:serine/threonine-protein kinase [Kofleriaceae bacterium]
MTDALNLAGAKLGNYRLLRMLGRGNMGVVYLATDEALLRPTAVKVLTWSPHEHDPEAWFLAEARSVAKLNHPSVVQIYSVARHGPHRYIAMEYVEGVSADIMVSRKGPFSAERATEVILQLAAALELAHGSGIIHRDVKPGNILIKADGTAKLGDFGMAVSTQRPAGNDVRAGTPHYFAPEIWRGEPATIATDINALGATYYYLLTGRPPLDGSTIAGLSAAHQRQEVVAPPELAANVAAACMRVVRRCMAKSPGERFESARAAAWEARGVLRELESPGLVAAPGEPRRRPDTTPPTLREPDEGWLARGFRFEPFTDLDPSDPPYRGAPFDSLRRELGMRTAASGTTVILAGAPGSGRSVLARSVLAASPGRGAYIDVGHAARPGSVVQRIARTFGAVASPNTTGSPELEGLLELLAAGSPATSVPLIVLDGVVAGTRATADASMLARAARSTRYFSLLVVGPAELSVEAGGSIPAGEVITVPTLTPLQIGQYLDSWLRATRPPEAPTLIITVDAALIAGHRANGNLDQLNALARQMIVTGSPVVTSWDAWTALDDHQAALDEPSVRPAAWPTEDVLRLINHCRVAAGLAERGQPG